MLINAITPSDFKTLYTELGVDGAGIKILSQKSKLNFFLIKELHVGAANILKQDALSIGADLAVPKGVIVAKEPFVDVVLIATTRQLLTLSKKELAQPFGLKDVAIEIKKYLSPKKFEPKIMGILNANDDSFYSSSRFNSTDAIDRIFKMIEDGADIIDIGAVSSRPGSIYPGEDIEFQRLKDILDIIKKESLYNKVKFSLDSYSSKSIKYALESGFSMVNDITGLKDVSLATLASSYNASVVIMHMLSNPKDMQNEPHYNNILKDISDFFEQAIDVANDAGVKDIILDVGIGFGKTLEHNLDLIKNLSHFKKFNKELLIGVSRKSMIDKIYPSTPDQRLAGSLTLNLKALENGASILRVHDVKETAQAVEVFKALNK